MQTEKTFSIVGSKIRIIHYHSDGTINVYDNSGKCLVSHAHDEHENAVVTFNILCETFTALEECYSGDN
jgi:hypothetical protein